jgi:hypothetical protein
MKAETHHPWMEVKDVCFHTKGCVKNSLSHKVADYIIPSISYSGNDKIIEMVKK